MWTRPARAPLAALLLLVARASLADAALVPPLPSVPPAPPPHAFHAELLPAVVQRPGPLGLLWWQWLGLLVLLVLSFAVGALLGFVTRVILTKVAARTRNTWDEMAVGRATGPLAALWAIAFFTAFHPWLELGGSVEAVLEKVLRASTYLVLFWAAYRMVDVAFVALAAAPRTRANPGLTGLLPLLQKTCKVVLIALGAVAVLNELGFQVTSLLAGVGIGGVALALAAQKTVENLFASVSLGVDQPFRVGDFVKIEDFVGTVESIGIRSTRIRTLDRTIITMPNGKLADSRSETFAARDRIRLYANLALSYRTTAAQVRRIVAEVEAALRSHPKLSSETPSVRLTELKEWSLNVEVMAWFRTTDWGEFLAIRQELLLRFMEIVEQAGTTFAVPIRELRMDRGARLSARAPRIGGADRDRTDDL